VWYWNFFHFPLDKKNPL